MWHTLVCFVWCFSSPKASPSTTCVASFTSRTRQTTCGAWTCPRRCPGRCDVTMVVAAVTTTGKWRWCTRARCIPVPWPQTGCIRNSTSPRICKYVDDAVHHLWGRHFLIIRSWHRLLSTQMACWSCWFMKSFVKVWARVAALIINS